MRIVLQRVRHGSVDVLDEETGKRDLTFEPQTIGQGYVLLVGVSDTDGDEQIAWLVHKIANLRVFEDENGKMNLSLKQIGGQILSVSQFTLYADTKKGNRPSFTDAQNPNEASKNYDRFNEKLREEGVIVETGVFGADMKVSFTNDGPVTIIFDTDNK